MGDIADYYRDLSDDWEAEHKTAKQKIKKQPKEKVIYHRTKDGRKIRLQDMTLEHLKNTIKLIEKRAAEGITVRRGGGFTAEDMWYDEYEISGEKALKRLNYYHYKAELTNRTL